MSSTVTFDPIRDLVIEREIGVPRARVWAALTEPERLRHWYMPAPWQTVDCEIDLRPGGIFRTVARSPEGVDQAPLVACFLDVVAHEKLVWTTLLGPGFRPTDLNTADGCHGLSFTAVVTLEDTTGGTRYRALVMHADADNARKHADLGFTEGWGTTLDQLAAILEHGTTGGVIG